MSPNTRQGCVQSKQGPWPQPPEALIAPELTFMKNLDFAGS